MATIQVALRVGLGVHHTEQAHNILSLKTEAWVLLNPAERSVALGAEVTGVTVSDRNWWVYQAMPIGGRRGILFPL